MWGSKPCWRHGGYIVIQGSKRYWRHWRLLLRTGQEVTSIMTNTSKCNFAEIARKRKHVDLLARRTVIICSLKMHDIQSIEVYVVRSLLSLSTITVNVNLFSVGTAYPCAYFWRCHSMLLNCVFWRGKSTTHIFLLCWNMSVSPHGSFEKVEWGDYNSAYNDS